MKQTAKYKPAMPLKKCLKINPRGISEEGGDA